MNLNDPRDLLWMAGICYGISFVVGILKTFRVEIESLKNIPILAIACGFVIQTRALYLRGLEVHGCPLGNTLERIQFILWSLILAFLILRIIWRLNLLGTFCAGLAMGAGFLSLSLPGVTMHIGPHPIMFGSFLIHGSNCMHPLPFSVTAFFLFWRLSVECI